MKSLILEGFMGCGKSSAAEALSKELDLPLYDTDALIEKKQNMTINEIFDKMGEPAFRDMETKVLEELGSLKRPGIISLGGGMPVRPENRELLKKLGVVFYLKAPADLLYDRLMDGKENESRPMLKGHDLKERIEGLLNEREEVYLSAADFTVALSPGMSVKDIVFSVRKACGI